MIPKTPKRAAYQADPPRIFSTPHPRDQREKGNPMTENRNHNRRRNCRGSTFI
jgi:hypothetical protein